MDLTHSNVNSGLSAVYIIGGKAGHNTDLFQYRS